MKRLKKAMFRNLNFESLGINNDKAIELISQKDSRLNNDNVILYNNESSFGGIYKDIINMNLFAVEFYSFEVYEKDTDKDISYVGVIATGIDYLDSKGNFQEPKLNLNNQYTEVYNKIGANKSKNIVSEIKNHVTIEDLSLEYVSLTFREAAEILQLYA